MALCDSHVIDLANHYFVPLYMSDLNIPAEKWDALYGPSHHLSADARKLLTRLRQEFKYKPLFPEVQSFIVTPSGALLGHFPGMAADPKALFTGQLQHAISTLHLTAGPTLMSYNGHAYASRQGDRSLRVVMRYVDPNYMHDLDQLHADDKLYLRTVGPSMDWVVLDAAACESLLPAATMDVGSTYKIPQDVARSILIRFRPEPSALDNLVLEKAMSRIRTASLDAQLCSIENNEGLVCLKGSFNAMHPGLAGLKGQFGRGDGNWVEANIVGYLKYNTVTRQLDDLQLASSKMEYCSAYGKRVALRASAELVANSEK